MSCLSAVASPLKTTMGNVHKYTKTWPGQIRISFHWPVSTLREIWPRFWRWPHVTPPYLIINGHIAWFYDSIIQASGLLKRTCFSLRRYTAFKRSIAPGRSWYLVSTIIGTNFAKHSASNCWVPSFIIWATSLGSNKIASCKMLQGCSIQVVTGWGCKYCKYEMGKWDKTWWNESMCMCRHSSVDYLNSQSRDWVNTT